MIRVTYYIEINDNDTPKQELTKNDFITILNKIFKDYIVFEGRFIDNNGIVATKRTLIISTFVKVVYNDEIKSNCNILKKEFNQESIPFEVTESGAIYG